MMKITLNYGLTWNLSPASIVNDVPVDRFPGYAAPEGPYKVSLVMFTVDAITFPLDDSIPSGQKKVWTMDESSDSANFPVWEDDGTGQMVWLDPNVSPRLWARIVFYHNGAEWTWNTEIINSYLEEVSATPSYENI